MTAESRAIRRGIAKRVFFAWGDHKADDLQKILDRMAQPILAVQVDTLVNAFRVAVDRFVEASENDPELNRRIEAMQGKNFEHLEVRDEATPDSI